MVDRQAESPAIRFLGRGRDYFGWAHQDAAQRVTPGSEHQLDPGLDAAAGNGLAVRLVVEGGAGVSPRPASQLCQTRPGE